MSSLGLGAGRGVRLEARRAKQSHYGPRVRKIDLLM
jgi:hypothetical protein